MFLENIGRRSEAELYLRLFRRLPKESFAIIAAESSLLSHAPGSVAQQLGYLDRLGLVAPVVLGLLEPEQSLGAAEQLAGELRTAGLRPVLRSAWASPFPEIVDDLRQERTPILAFGAAGAPREERFRRVGELAAQLDSRKLVVVRRRGGLGPHGQTSLTLAPGHVLPCQAGGISVVNLRTDHEALLEGRVLSQQDTDLLESLAKLLDVPLGLLVSVTSPWGLLRELFTVKGEGTLLKRGARIERATSYQGLELERLRALLEASFGSRVGSDFFERSPEVVFYEPNYRGVAIVEASQSIPLLSKFAVDPIAQGEGMGRDLWEALIRDFESLVWRARPANPIVPWYVAQCDGMVRSGEWIVFWRGLELATLPGVVAELVERPADFIAPSFPV